MSEYGVKICNYEAASIFSVMNGTRAQYDRKNSLLINSLFLKYMKPYLNINRYGFTKDIVGLNYGTPSHEEEYARIKKMARANRIERRACRGILKREQKALATKEHIQNLYDFWKNNPEMYDKKSKEEVRESFYKDGFKIKYRSQEISYVRLTRTPGQAKQGKVLCIRKSLFKKAHEFLYMGFKPRKGQEIDLTGLECYASLVTSSISAEVKIRPEDILVLKDVNSTFRTNVTCVELDDNKHLRAVRRNNFEVDGDMFDGESLVDKSFFEANADFDGFILLRSFMFKTCGFCCDIQKFFQDYYGEAYASNPTIKDMWGNEHHIHDIKVITTHNATKYIKYNISYEHWCEWVHSIGDTFGVVKSAHISRIQEHVQRTSYQMIQTLNIPSITRVMGSTIEYIEKLKTDLPTFIDYLKKHANFFNDFEPLVAILEQCPEFEQSSYFRTRRSAIISAYVLDFKFGRCRVNGDYCTLVGSPYALLLYSVGESVEDDPTLRPEEDGIACYARRFANGEWLAGFRSPHNHYSNILPLHNHKHELMERYFDFGDYVCAVCTLHTDVEARGNGLDFDSDQIMLTNQFDIVEQALKCYKDNPTIVNMVPMRSASYHYTADDLYHLDVQGADAQLAIGESSNAAAIALTYEHTFGDKKYDDYACILSVIAQLAIDSIKKEFDVSLSEEIKRIKEDMDMSEHKYPLFWKYTHKGFPATKININLKCPMNEIARIGFQRHMPTTPTISIEEFITQEKLNMPKKRSKKIEKLIEDYSLELYDFRTNTLDEDKHKQYLYCKMNFEILIDDIKRISMSYKYRPLFIWLLNREFMITDNIKWNRNKIESTLMKNRSLLLKILWNINPDVLLSCVKSPKNRDTPTIT